MWQDFIAFELKEIAAGQLDQEELWNAWDATQKEILDAIESIIPKETEDIPQFIDDLNNDLSTRLNELTIKWQVIDQLRTRLLRMFYWTLIDENKEDKEILSILKCLSLADLLATKLEKSHLIINHTIRLSFLKEIKNTIGGLLNAYLERLTTTLTWDLKVLDLGVAKNYFIEALFVSWRGSFLYWTWETHIMNNSESYNYLIDYFASRNGKYRLLYVMRILLHGPCIFSSLTKRLKDKLDDVMFNITHEKDDRTSEFSEVLLYYKRGENHLKKDRSIHGRHIATVLPT